jgi:hypothetical protein
MIDLPKVVLDLEAENAWLKKEIEAMKQDLEQFQMALAEQVELNKNLERKCAAQKTSFYVTMLKLFPEKSHDEIAKEMEALLGEDVPTIAYLNGVAEGKKHKDALVAAAYRAAANVASGLGYGGEIADKILSLTPADAEKALRDFGMEVSSGVNEMLKERLRLAFDKSSLEQNVDEVMKK